jgi:hypothetical protein
MRLRVFLVLGLVSIAVAADGDALALKAFEAAYRRAHEGRDLQQMQTLMYVRDTPESSKERMLRSFEETFHLTIESINIAEGTRPEFHEPVDIDGHPHFPNLRITHTMTVAFKAQGDLQQTSVLPIGRIGERLYMVMPSRAVP